METLIGFCMIIGLAVLIFSVTLFIGFLASGCGNDVEAMFIISWLVSSLLVLGLTCTLLSDRGVFDLFMGGLAK